MLSWVQLLQVIGGCNFQRCKHGEAALAFHPGQQHSKLRSATFLSADFNEMSRGLK